MCDLCKQVVTDSNKCLKIAEVYSAWAELVGKGSDIEQPCIRVLYFNAEYLKHIEIPINFCPYCGSKISQTFTRRPTGLVDCNGHPLFEGDIVETKYGRYCKIVWFDSPSHHGWDLVPWSRLDKRAPDSWDLWEPENLMRMEL